MLQQSHRQMPTQTDAQANRCEGLARPAVGSKFITLHTSEGRNPNLHLSPWSPASFPAHHAQALSILIEGQFLSSKHIQLLPTSMELLDSMSLGTWDFVALQLSPLLHIPSVTPAVLLYRVQSRLVPQLPSKLLPQDHSPKPVNASFLTQ